MLGTLPLIASRLVGDLCCALDLVETENECGSVAGETGDGSAENQEQLLSKKGSLRLKIQQGKQRRQLKKTQRQTAVASVRNAEKSISSI